MKTIQKLLPSFKESFPKIPNSMMCISSREHSAIKLNNSMRQKKHSLKHFQFKIRNLMKFFYALVICI